MSLDVETIKKGIKFLGISLIGVILSLFSYSEDFKTTLILSMIAITIFICAYLYTKKVIEE